MTDPSTASAPGPSAPEPRLTARDLALIAVFAGFIAALALPGAFAVPGSTVPITAQTLGVMLAGCILGGRRGALAVLTFLLLVAAGLPLLPPSPTRPQGGLGVFTSASAGFFLGWVAGAWVIGRLVELAPRRFTLGWFVLANLIGGIVVVYAFGIPVMAWAIGKSIVAATVLSAVYLPGDLIKAVTAAIIAGAVHRGYPVITRRLDRSTEAAR